MALRLNARDAQRIKESVRQTRYNDPSVTELGSSGDATRIDRFWGKIVSSGPANEADYGDSRYWFKLAQLTTTGTAGTEPNTWTVPATTNAEYVHATLEDIASKRSGSRILKVDDIVEVFMSADINHDTQKVRYFCDSGGGGSVPMPQYQYQFLGSPAQNSIGYMFIPAHPMI